MIQKLIIQKSFFISLMSQLSNLAKQFRKYYNKYKQQQNQSKRNTKTNVTTCNQLLTIPVKLNKNLNIIVT